MTDPTFEDRILIRETYGRYARAAAKQDSAGWLGSWSDDAVWITPNFTAQGKAQLEQFWGVTWQMFKSVAAFSEIGEIMVMGDRATADTMVHEIMQLASGDTSTMTGHYVDELVRRGDRWVFAKRHYLPISMSGAPLGA